MRIEGENSFTATIEITRGFKTPPERVEAEIHFSLSGSISGVPRFESIVVEGKPLPRSYVSDAALLRAYAKYRAGEL